MTSTIFIQNLKCGGCAATIKNALSKISGITDVQVNNESDSVSFETNAEELITNVKSTLEKLGYPEITDPNSLLLKAKSFVSCAIGRVDNIMGDK